MSRFSREGYNAVVAIHNQTNIQATIQSLISQCDNVALVAIGLQFGEGTPQQAHQESASTHCQKLRRHVRDSDIIYLYSNGTGQYGLFFILPEANMEGGQVVHQRLQELLSSSILSQTALAIPEHIEIHRYAIISGKGNCLSAAPSSTTMRVCNGEISVQTLPSQQRLPAAGQEEPLFLSNPAEQ
ncbi:MAG TPA: hypothetical protein VFA10_29375 [Ktedonobacteraceae bacterium]|nr:hypothetical protein [Ktedonobacteraceae bacterium]